MHGMSLKIGVLCCLGAGQIHAADPTFLRLRIPDIQPKRSDLSISNAQNRAVFGSGYADARQLKSIASYGELTVDADGSSESVRYPAEERTYYILHGSGALGCDGHEHRLKKNDFACLPVGVKHHGMANHSGGPVRLLVMGFKIPVGANAPAPPAAQIANADDVKLLELKSHGATALFRDFTPGGTHIPHHHATAEGIYYVMHGHGDMVAGGGESDNEGRLPAPEGNAYFIRLNTIVGFYTAQGPATDLHALILAARSMYPFPKNNGL